VSSLAGSGGGLEIAGAGLRVGTGGGLAVDAGGRTDGAATGSSDDDRANPEFTTRHIHVYTVVV